MRPPSPMRGGGDPLLDISPCDLADACDDLEVSALHVSDLLPVWPDCPPLIGRAATVRLVPVGHPDDPGGSPLAAMLAALAQMRGAVACIAGVDGVQGWGSILSASAQHYGVVGAVIDGAVRDIDGIVEFGVPVVGRGVHPARMHGRAAVAEVGAPLAFAAGTVHPGDLVAADRSGVVVVPSAHVEAVTARARERLATERARLTLIRAGEDPRDLFDGPRTS